MERSTVQSEYYGPHDDIVDLYKRQHAERCRHAIEDGKAVISVEHILEQLSFHFLHTTINSTGELPSSADRLRMHKARKVPLLSTPHSQFPRSRRPSTQHAADDRDPRRDQALQAGESRQPLSSPLPAGPLPIHSSPLQPRVSRRHLPLHPAGALETVPFHPSPHLGSTRSCGASCSTCAQTPKPARRVVSPRAAGAKPTSRRASAKNRPKSAPANSVASSSTTTSRYPFSLPLTPHVFSPQHRQSLASPNYLPFLANTFYRLQTLAWRNAFLSAMKRLPPAEPVRCMRALFPAPDSEPLSPCFSSLSTETADLADSLRDANCATGAVSATSSGTWPSGASTGSFTLLDSEPRESSVFASCRVATPGTTTLLFPRFYSFVQVIVFREFHVVCEETPGVPT